jgi:hypothetical protein
MSKETNIVVNLTIKQQSTTVPVPPGWRVLTVEEAIKYKSLIDPNLGQWDILALDYGRYDGPGYGSKITPGPYEQIGNMLLISEKF